MADLPEFSRWYSIDVPLTVGVVGTLLTPQLAVIGAVIVLLIDGSIVVEKTMEVDEEAIADMFEI